VLTNAAHCGFVQSVNRALTFCRGDVLLLNSDTRLFAGSIDELWQAAQSDPRIGSVTALSNNATIFSYPIADAACERLADIGWGEVAAVALQVNAGIVLDVPTAHGFCMLIRREMLDRVGLLDEAFGRGYGEENDLCLRAADLGFRHVAAAGVVVEHRESVSFGDEKLNLLKANLARLEERFPEYPADVREFLKRDGLRSARWPVDRFRLQRVASAGGRFVLIVRNWLQGGTQKAIDDIAALAGYGQMIALDLSATIDGSLRLACEAPHLCAVFAAEEYEALWHLLEGLPIAAALIHQLLGFNAGFIGALRRRRGGMRHIYYVHDFYSFCPRVTMIDAIGTFCDVAPVEVCARCVEIGGAHEASRLTDLEPAQHRALFAKLLAEMDEIVVPSANAAGYLDRGLPGLRTTVRPHPEAPEAYQVAGPAGIGCDIVLLGALGPHKGSGKLLEIAQRARLVAPDLRFHVIGYTDIDEALLETGVVSISGPYEQDKLCSLVAATGAAIALFLHRWPETFSYTLSESVQLGLIPLVPDIGAPADRVRAAGYGVVYGFPIEAGEVLRVLVDVIGGRIDPAPGGVGPARFAASAGAALYREGAWLLGMAAAAP
jgi:glycosyltransferase involved in cell wall biosynthesis